MPLYVPERHKVLEPDGRMSRPWLTLFNDITQILGLIVGPGGVAPSDAEYIVASANALLTASRVLQDSSSVTWDFSTPGQASATVIASGFLLRGTRASQPLATAVPAGTEYYVTDEKVNEQSDGATWLVYSAAQRTAGQTEISIDGYFAQGAAPPTQGGLRLSNTHGVFGRNAANTQNQHIAVVTASDNVVIGPSLPNDLAFWTDSTVRWRVVSTGQFRAENGTETIQWGANASFPMLKRSSTILQVRLADDSDWAPLESKTLGVGKTAAIAQVEVAGQIRVEGEKGAGATNGIGFLNTVQSDTLAAVTINRRSRDNAGAPEALQSGDTIAAYACQGYDGTDYGPTNNGSAHFNASETYTTTAKGSEFVVATTPNGSTTRADRWKVTNAGHLQAQGGHYIETQEMAAPGAGAANTVRLYAEDDGSGKTRLMVQFGTGAAIQLAIEP